MSEQYHEGRPIVHSHARGVYFLCPVGHSLTFIRMKDWAGSYLEAKVSDPAWRVRCYGTLPTAATGLVQDQ